MSVEIRVPRLGWSMEEGTFVEWLRADGARVAPGDPLFLLESDKAAQEIEAVDAGVLQRLPDGPEPGAVVKVGQVIGRLIATPDMAVATPDTASVGSAVRTSPPAPARPETVRTADPTSRVPGVVASPRARRAANELSVDWSTLAGSGRGGRVRERDVRASAPAPTAPPAAAALNRKAIADRLVAGLRATAPVTLTTRAVATNLVALIHQFKALDPACDRPRPGMTDVLVKLVAHVLQGHPALNARWEDGRIVAQPDIHVGIAVDTDAGLLVPVVRDVPRLGLRDVAARSRELIGKARARRLSAEDQRGGTFTVTNLGMYGVDAFTPILNPPETAILGVGAVRREPALDASDRVVPVHRLTLSLTFDHRVVDGAPAARFLRDVAAAVENAAAILVG